MSNNIINKFMFSFVTRKISRCREKVKELTNCNIIFILLFSQQLFTKDPPNERDSRSQYCGSDSLNPNPGIPFSPDPDPVLPLNPDPQHWP